MRATIQKWGNSLAVRIPKPRAEFICALPESFTQEVKKKVEALIR